MLRHLHISNFVLIEQCTLDFGSGLCVMTGETGAGKSILLDALGLVLGGRLTGSVLRDEKKPAVISAEFSMNKMVKALLAEAGVEATSAQVKSQSRGICSDQKCPLEVEDCCSGIGKATGGKPLCHLTFNIEFL